MWRFTSPTRKSCQLVILKSLTSTSRMQNRQNCKTITYWPPFPDHHLPNPIPLPSSLHLRPPWDASVSASSQEALSPATTSLLSLPQSSHHKSRQLIIPSPFPKPQVSLSVTVTSALTIDVDHIGSITCWLYWAPIGKLKVPHPLPHKKITQTRPHAYEETQFAPFFSNSNSRSPSKTLALLATCP